MPPFFQTRARSRLFRNLELRWKFYSRILRAATIRSFLKLCLFLLYIEKWFHPIIRDDKKRILVMVFGGLGDCLLFDPLFRRLSEHYPGARIDVLTAMFKEMWDGLDSVDNIIYFSPVKAKTPWAYFLLFRTLYRSAYDIVAEGLAMLPMRGIYPIFTALVFEATRAPVRIGRISTGRQALMRPRELGFIGREEMAERAKLKSDSENSRYITHTIRLEPSALRQYHESARIFEPLGVPFKRLKGEPRLTPDPSASIWADKLLRTQWGRQQDLIIGMTMETTRKIKSWPLENFVSIVEKGIRDGLRFVLIGVERQPDGSPFRRFPREALLDLSGGTSIGEMMAIISRCNLFFSCDTGPAHIAQACGIPNVVLFGPSNEMEFGPFDRELHTLILPEGEWPCRPCVLGPCIHKTPCMESISVEVAYREIQRKLDQFPTPMLDIPAGEEKRPGVLCAV